MLLNVVTMRPASVHARASRRWRAGVQAAWRRFKQWLFERPSACRLEALSVSALKDIGLTPGDLPAIRTSRYFSDRTRQQR